MTDSRPHDLFQRARDLGQGRAQPPRRLGSYELLGELGRGGFGCVYRARDSTGREVALKLLIDLGGDQVERFRREAKATANLSHPNVLRIHSADSVEGQLFLVTELVPDCLTLDRVLSATDRRRGLTLILSAAEGLAHAHERGLTHRDVKPSNLLVGSDGRLRVADFGLVLAEEDQRLTQTGLAVGTPRYMAPEQRAGLRRIVGPASDVWALGVILYRFLTGVFPYEDHVTPPLLLSAAPPRSLRDYDATIPKALDRVCLRALAPDPANRYPDAGAFGRDLLAALEGRGGAPKSLVALVVLAALAVAGIAWGVAERGTGREATPTLSPTASAGEAPSPRSSAALAPGPDPLAPPRPSSQPLLSPPSGVALPRLRLSSEVPPPRLEAEVTEIVIWGASREGHDQLDRIARGEQARSDHLLQRGRLRLELGRHTEARADFEGFVRRSPPTSSYRGLGLAFVSLSYGMEGDRGQALKSGSRVLEEARGVQPSFLRVPQLYALVARGYLLVSATSQAEQVVQEGLAKFPENPLLQATLADVRVDQGELSQAWEHFATGAKLSEGRRQWLLLSAEARLLVGARADAVLILEEYLEVVSAPAERWFALMLRCEARIGLGQLEAAEADLMLLEAGPPSWRLAALRARLCLARRDPAGAQRALARAEAGDPSLDLLRARRAWLEGRFSESLECVDAALRKGARPAFRGRALALRAFVLAQTSRRVESRESAKRALELLPEPERELIQRLRALRSSERGSAKTD